MTSPPPEHQTRRQTAGKGCGRQVSLTAQLPHRRSRARVAFWLARMSRTIFFLVVVLSLAGVYAALQVPISVFPETNFPRVVIGVDNGVMPVEQMQVTITKPIEDAVNSVPGLLTVRSTTSPRLRRSRASSSTGTSTCSRRCSLPTLRWPTSARSLPRNAR